MLRLVAVVLTVLAALISPAAAHAKRTVSAPAEVVVGQTFKLTTSGWKRGERLRLYFGQPNTDNIGLVKTGRADRRGRGTFAVKLRAPTVVGRMGLTVAVVRRGNFVRRATRIVQVHGTAPDRQMVLDPEAGAAGPLTLDRSTEQEIVAALGPPTRRHSSDRGVALTYACGEDCRSEMWVNAQTGALSDVVTTSTRWRTPQGTTVWMSDTEAARRQRDEFSAGCIDALTVEGAAGRLALERQQGIVRTVYLASAASSVITC